MPSVTPVLWVPQFRCLLLALLCFWDGALLAFWLRAGKLKELHSQPASQCFKHRSAQSDAGCKQSERPLVAGLGSKSHRKQRVTNGQCRQPTGLSVPRSLVAAPVCNMCTYIGDMSHVFTCMYYIHASVDICWTYLLWEVAIYGKGTLKITIWFTGTDYA